MKIIVLVALLLPFTVLVSCEKEEDPKPDTRTKPSVLMYAASNLQPNSALITAEVTQDGGATVTERGFVYSLTQNPDLNDIKVVAGSGKGIYNHTLNNLTPNTRYYVRAFAINVKGTAYSLEISFTTPDITK